MLKPRFIAFYLPQFHPIPLNDEWWGKGYTEWRSVTTARPLFKGHYQPHVPADLGYYDLRLPLIQEEQVELAKEAGIEGFCYWHYWMGRGRTLLETPFLNMLNTKRPDFPFCLGWANHDWTNKSWTKQSVFAKEKNMVEMDYSHDDYVQHFNYVLPAFKDNRYIRVDGKPLFYVFNPKEIEDCKDFICTWRDLAKKNGLPGLYFVGKAFNMSASYYNERGKLFIPRTDESAKFYGEILNMGFDGVNSRGDFRAETLLEGRYMRFLKKAMRKFGIQFLKKYDYSAVMKKMFVEEDKWDNVFPTIIPNWDRSPRAGKDAVIYHNSTPEKFMKSVKDALNLVKGKPEEQQIIFIKSWNEWGEGNHLEPDVKFGHGYLNAIKRALDDCK